MNEDIDLKEVFKIFKKEIEKFYEDFNKHTLYCQNNFPAPLPTSVLIEKKELKNKIKNLIKLMSPNHEQINNLKEIIINIEKILLNLKNFLNRN